MLNPEFITEFDVLYNNILSDQAPGLNTYEKSVYLSNAQDDVVLDIYKGASLGTPFENAEDARRYISVLNSQKTIPLSQSIGGNSMEGEDFFKVAFRLPDDILFITYESATITGDELYCSSGHKSKEAIVVPCEQDDFWRTVRSPFRRPNASRILKLEGVGATGNGRVSELVTKYPITAYTIRYIRMPRPIVLEDMELEYGPGVSVRGVTAETSCELPDVLHKEILMRAVTAAKAVWLSTLNTNNNDR